MSKRADVHVRSVSFVSMKCPLRGHRRICLEATTVAFARLVSTVALDGLLLMLTKFYRLTPLKPMALWCRKSFTKP
jgi:hypothetical protein